MISENYILVKNVEDRFDPSIKIPTLMIDEIKLIRELKKEFNNVNYLDGRTYVVDKNHKTIATLKLNMRFNELKKLISEGA